MQFAQMFSQPSSTSRTRPDRGRAQLVVSAYESGLVAPRGG